MKTLSTCELCRMGILTKAPLCLGCRSLLTCALGDIFRAPQTINKELPL